MTQQSALKADIAPCKLTPACIRRFKDRDTRKQSAEKSDREPKNANASPVWTKRQLTFRQKRRSLSMRKPSNDGFVCHRPTAG